MIIGIMTVILWITCVLIVCAVLLQTGKGGGLAGIFGGGAGPESLLGTRAASFLVKVTVVLCVLFLTLCLLLNRLGQGGINSSKYDSPAAGTSEDGGADNKTKSVGGGETTATKTEGGETTTDKDEGNTEPD